MRTTRLLPASLATLVLLLVVLPLRLTETALPMGSDQGLYSYVGQSILHGGLPYRDVWDVKPPGVFYARAAVQGVEQAMLPTDWLQPCFPGPLHASCPWFALQVSDLVYTLLFGLVLYLTGRAVGLVSAASALAAVLGTASMSLARVSQQGFTSEKLVLLPALLAVLCGLRGVRGSTFWWPLAGLAAGMAVLAKQPGGTVLVPVLVLAVAYTRARRVACARASLVLAGVIAPLVLVAVGFYLQGALVPMVESTLTVNLRRLSTNTSSDWGFSLTSAPRDAFHVFRDGLAPLWLLGGVGIVATLRAPRGPLRVIALGAALDTLLIVRAREYLQLTPSYALLGGWVVHRVWLSASQRPHFGLESRLAARGLLVGLLATVVLLTGEFQGGVTMRVVNERGLRDFIGSPEERLGDDLRQMPPGPLFVWGNGAQLYLFSGRAPASQFINAPGQLDTDWPGSNEARAELMAELRRVPPTIIVTEPPRGEGFRIDGFPALQELLQYQYAKRPPDGKYPGWNVYVRHSST